MSDARIRHLNRLQFGLGSALGAIAAAALLLAVFRLNLFAGLFLTSTLMCVGLGRFVGIRLRSSRFIGGIAGGSVSVLAFILLSLHDALGIVEELASCVTSSLVIGTLFGLIWDVTAELAALFRGSRTDRRG